MKTKSITKLALSFILTISILIAGSISVFAADTTDTGTGTATGTVTTTGTISATTISVTHPAVVSYTINPNTSTFTATDISIVNNTVAPISVTITSLASVASEGGVTFTDVLPAAKTWGSLGVADSSKYIALGIVPKVGGWNAGYNTVTHYAADAGTYLAGTINSASTGVLNLSANYGKAFNTSITASHTLSLSFSLVS